MTWVGDLHGDIHVESLNERSESNPHKLLVLKQGFVDAHCEEFEWTVDESS